MILDLFVTTIKEYKRFSKQLPLKNYEENSTVDESLYAAIQVRLMLLRKYISKNSNVYFENLVIYAKSIFQQEANHLQNMMQTFLQFNQQSFEHILSDGTKLNLYESIEDVMYGLYLHADYDKVIRLSRTSETLRVYFTKIYVVEVEKIIFELYDFLTSKNILGITQSTHEKSPVINLENIDCLSQDIKNSPYWKNLYGQDVADEEMESFFTDLSEDERYLIVCSNLFLTELEKDDYSIEILRRMVHESTFEQWGDFSEANYHIRMIKNRGISSIVRFNDDKDIAYVRIFRNVDSAFVIQSTQIITGINDITFYKDKINNDWKIFSIGEPIVPILKEQ
jgi:hypothetical protein